MRWLPELRRLFRLPVRRPGGVADDVRAELDFHLAMRQQELEAAGLSPADAREAALRRFGDLDDASRDLIRTGRRRTAREAAAGWLGDLLRDLRFAARELRRDRATALVTVTVLGLGIGLTASIAGIAERLALNPLPYPGSDRLGAVWLTLADGEHSLRITPDATVRTALAATPGVVRLDVHRAEEAMVDLGTTPEVVPTRLVSPDLVSGLGGRILLGRGFTAADTSPGAPLTTILAERTWRSRFGSRTDVLGTAVRIDGRPAQIIGVLRAGFDLSPFDRSARADYWLPFRPDPLDPASDRASAIVTLAPGTTFAGVAEAAERRLAEGRGADGFASRMRVTVLDGPSLVSGRLRRTLGLLLGAVLLVLLVACANVAALLLGQALARFREFGVREALGAGRGRVLRQLGAEAGLLGGLGLVAGVGVTAAMLTALRSLRPASLPGVDDVRVLGPTLAVAAAVALASVVLFGLAPMWALSRGTAAAALVGRSRGPELRGSGRLRSALVVGQIAVTLMLLVGAGLLLKSFIRERHAPLGYDADGLSVVSFDLPERDVGPPAVRQQLVDEAVRRIRAVPGVQSVVPSGSSPINHGVFFGEFLAEGLPLPETERSSAFPQWWVSPGYFELVGQALVAGRSVAADAAVPEVLVDAGTAQRVWGTVDVVGRRVRFSREESGWHTVVGVVADVRDIGSAFEGAPRVFSAVPPGEASLLLVRSGGVSVLGPVSRILRDLHPALRIRSAATMPQLLDDEVAGDRFTLLIVAWFGVIAFGLAMVGLYGVIAYAVRRRRFEFGVRMALGAPPRRVRSLVFREALGRLAVGILVGLAASFGMVRLVRGMLYQVDAWDPVVFGSVAAAVVLTGMAAVWLPAVRASRADPLVVIRSE